MEFRLVAAASSAFDRRFRIELSCEYRRGLVAIGRTTGGPSAVADALTKTPLRRGMHVERTALLIGDSAIFSLQVERMIREANNPNRRAFRNGYELEPSVVPHLKTWVIWERRWAG